MADSFIVRPDGFYHIDKDPQAELVYTADLRDWIANTGSLGIASASVTVEPGMSTSGSAGISGGYVSQKLTGGTIGQAYEAVWEWITLDVPPQKDQRTIVIHVRAR